MIKGPCTSHNHERHVSSSQLKLRLGLCKTTGVSKIQGIYSTTRNGLTMAQMSSNYNPTIMLHPHLAPTKLNHHHTRSYYNVIYARGYRWIKQVRHLLHKKKLIQDDADDLKLTTGNATAPSSSSSPSPSHQIKLSYHNRSYNIVYVPNKQEGIWHLLNNKNGTNDLELPPYDGTQPPPTIWN